MAYFTTKQGHFDNVRKIAHDNVRQNCAHLKTGLEKGLDNVRKIAHISLIDY